MTERVLKPCPCTEVERSDSGLYTLWLEVAQGTELTVGALGPCSFDAGLYAYVGRARKGRAARVARHLRSDKRPHWHIDYLRPAGRVVAVTYVDTPTLTECGLVEHLIHQLGGMRAVRGFGAGDCRCDGHLLRFRDRNAWRRLETIAPGEIAGLEELPHA